MLKLLHSLILLVFLSANLFFMTSFAFEEQTYQENEVQTVTSDSVKVNDLDIEPMNTRSVKKSVVPNTKKESKKVFHLFLKTMSAVGLSALFLYFILLLAKKFRILNIIPKNEEFDEYEYYDLGTPNNKQEALKSFLNKTK